MLGAQAVDGLQAIGVDAAKDFDDDGNYGVACISLETDYSFSRQRPRCSNTLVNTCCFQRGVVEVVDCRDAVI